MLRTIDLRSFLRNILRFSTFNHSKALGDSYMALWRLPRPDLHRLVNTDFQGTPSDCYGLQPKGLLLYKLCYTHYLNFFGNY